MYLGMTVEKLLLIGLIAATVIGPQRLPHLAARLAQAVKWSRNVVRAAGSRAKEELGPEFTELDWAKLDPRQYDPRRIVRDALRDPPARPAPSKRSSTGDPAGARTDRSDE